MIHQVVSEIWVFRMGSTILEHPVYMFLFFFERISSNSKTASCCFIRQVFSSEILGLVAEHGRSQR